MGAPAVLKKSLSLIGIGAGDPARPVLPVNDKETLEKIRGMLDFYGLR